MIRSLRSVRIDHFLVRHLSSSSHLIKPTSTPHRQLSLPSRSQTASPLFSSFKSQLPRTALAHGFHFVRYNTTQAEETSSAAIASISPEALNSQAIATVVNDPSSLADLHALGLGSYFTPVGWIQNGLEALHMAGIPWWASILAATLTARIVMFPLFIKQMKNAARLNNIQPKLEELTTQLRQANSEGNTMLANRSNYEIQMLFKKHDCNPLRSLLFPLIQIPFFISFFIGIRKMANLPLPSMQNEGLFWFPDLTAADPYYILPTLSAASMLLTIELGSDGIGPQQQKMKLFFRAMSIVMVPLTINFPSGIFLYWLTSNLFSLGQFGFLKIPGMKKRLGIPDMIRHSKKPGAVPTKGFWDSVKSSYEASVEKTAERKRVQKIEEERAARVVAGPPVILKNRQGKPKPQQKGN